MGMPALTEMRTRLLPLSSLLPPAFPITQPTAHSAEARGVRAKVGKEGGGGRTSWGGNLLSKLPEDWRRSEELSKRELY